MLFARCWVPDAPCLSETSSLELQHFTFLIKNLLLPPEEETTKAVFDFAQADTRHRASGTQHLTPNPPVFSPRTFQSDRANPQDRRKLSITHPAQDT